MSEESTKPTETETEAPATSAPGLTEKERLTGIMYSDTAWIVKPWMKAVFFYCAIAMLVGLVGYGYDKRKTMARLVMDSVVEPTPVKNIRAPDFTLPVGDQPKGFSLQAQRGKWVFVNFWATWCPPCRDEMPSMEMLNRRFKDKMVMVAVSVDEDWNEVNRFFGETKPTFEVLWDRNKSVATGQYGTRKFPESYLIDPNGDIAVKFVGPRDWYNVGTVEYFEEILNGTRDPRA